MLRKLSMFVLTFGLVLGVQWSQPGTASACEQWWAYNSCMDSAETHYEDCMQSCDNWLDLDPPASQIWVACTDRCNSQLESRSCNCYMYCDPWALCF